MTSFEFGLAADTHGPFDDERDAVEDAIKCGAGKFITGYLESGERRGWYWALEDDYVQLGGNRMKAVNL